MRRTARGCGRGPTPTGPGLRSPRRQRTGSASDAPALVHSKVDGRSEVDAAVEARDRGFIGAGAEGREAARRQSPVVVGVVNEGSAITEEISHDLESGTGLDGMARGELREGRGVQDRQPCGIDVAVYLRDGASQVVPVLRAPARDEGVREGDPDLDVCLGSLGQRRVAGGQHLGENGDRVPGRG